MQPAAAPTTPAPKRPQSSSSPPRLTADCLGESGSRRHAVEVAPRRCSAGESITPAAFGKPGDCPRDRPFPATLATRPLASSAGSALDVNPRGPPLFISTTRSAWLRKNSGRSSTCRWAWRAWDDADQRSGGGRGGARSGFVGRIDGVGAGINPLFPALQSGPMAVPRASRRKQIPSSQGMVPVFFQRRCPDIAPADA